MAGHQVKREPGRAAFLAAIAEEARSDWGAHEDLEEILSRLWQEARTAWSTLDLSLPTFASYLGARIDRCDESALEKLQSVDLYLTCSCSQGLAGAIEAFESYCAGEAERALAKLSMTEVEVEEVEQHLRDKLFVHESDGQIRIARYSGSGSLKSWYRVTALRTAIDLIRSEGRLLPVGDASELDGQAAHIDPELEYLKDKYRSDFKEAFLAALRHLESDERNLLRYQLLDGLSLEQVGAIYGLHLSSVSRRIGRIREKLLDSTRRELSERLRVDEEELDSIMRLIQSRLHVSVSRVLRAESQS
jgi:RNA polymerase sigma-70 factor (ECF subfamily)